MRKSLTLPFPLKGSLSALQDIGAPRSTKSSMSGVFSVSARQFASIKSSTRHKIDAQLFHGMDAQALSVRNGATHETYEKGD